MAKKVDKDLIERGMKVGELKMYQEDKIWSRYSNDKVDIGEELAKVIRTLSKEFPLSRPLVALSVGSSDEPQFRILETAFRGGLYLFDVDQCALDIVQERIRRQATDHVYTICGDYNKIFMDTMLSGSFLRTKLHGKRANLITLHHSLYYCEEDTWLTIVKNLYRKILAAKGAMHVVLMAAETSRTDSTTWLYNHFVGKFFGCGNDQDLTKLRKDMMGDPAFARAQVLLKRHQVRFFVDDFEKFMAVVWMILLYPNVHDYSQEQKLEITEFVYDRFWKKKIPMVQMQDHLVVYRGMKGAGAV